MKIIIPARLESGRVPHKLVQKIGDRTVIERTVYSTLQAAEKLNADVYVATDAEEIEAVLSDYDVRIYCKGQYAVDYSPVNGTERVACLAEAIGIPASEPIINVQGDKWGVVPEAIIQLGKLVRQHGRANVHQRHNTLYCLCEDLPEADRDNPSVVKVVSTHTGKGLYFMRAYVKNASKHCGIYGYYASFLQQYLHNMPLRSMEENESLEQMRVLENGGYVYCPHLEDIPTAGRTINTMNDLFTARECVNGVRAS